MPGVTFAVANCFFFSFCKSFAPPFSHLIPPPPREQAKQLQTYELGKGFRRISQTFARNRSNRFVLLSYCSTVRPGVVGHHTAVPCLTSIKYRTPRTKKRGGNNKRLTDICRNVTNPGALFVLRLVHHAPSPKHETQRGVQYFCLLVFNRIDKVSCTVVVSTRTGAWYKTRVSFVPPVTNCTTNCTHSFGDILHATAAAVLRDTFLQRQ